MRNLLILVICITAASMAGWFQIQRNGDRTTIEIDRREIREDARRAIDRGRDFLDERDAAAEIQEPTQQDPWLRGEVVAPRDWFGENVDDADRPRLEWQWSPQQP